VLRFRSILIVALLCSPVIASAQDTAADTAPFHRGQWAAQFAGGFGFGSLGVLRFTAPSRAWLLDFRLSGGHANSEGRSTNPDTLFKVNTGDRIVDSRYGGSLGAVSLVATVYF
jgi:hypothetical protein